MLARLFLLVALASAPAAWAANVNVVVTDAAGNPLPDAVVMLEPAGGRLPVKPMAGVQIAQHGLQFNPQLSVVTVGTPVTFPNQDTVKHHVYSFSAAKSFQIKLYSGVPHAPIVFDKPGVAVLGCNIHDGMVAWVVVTDTPLWARSGPGGRMRVEGVAPGSYEMHVWHASPALQTLTVAAGDLDQRVRLPAGGSPK